ncbi:MAG: M12 family metallo-peptidase [bacterium]|nr:M12 family metallo-peptidase [bacterium]
MIKLIVLMLACSVHIALADTLEVTLTIPSRGDVALKLERRDAFAPGSRIQVMTTAGPVNINPSTVKVYRGTLPNEPMSIVVLAVSKSGMIGSISVGAESFNVRRGPLASSPLQTNAILVTRNEPTVQPCSVADEKISNTVMRFMHEKSTETVQGTDTLDLQVAVETDHEFYRRNESDRDKSLAYIAQVIGMTSAIYERDVNVRITTSNVRLWEDADDPYPDDATSYTLLSVFSNLYESTMSDVQRDIALLMTMRGGLGGVAISIGGVCEKGRAYCQGDLVGDLANAPNSFAWDQTLFAHEIGHLCGGVHTQSCLWPGGPLDSCIVSEYGNCVGAGQTRPVIGTIMSYCHQRRADGGGLKAEFHPRHKRIIRSVLEQASCVGGRVPLATNVLRGRFIDQSTKMGIPNTSLDITVFVGFSGVGLGAVGPISTSLTSADGSFEFTGLADGIYTVVLPSGWAIVPFTINYGANSADFLVTDDLVLQDIEVVRVRPVKFSVTVVDSTIVDFVVVSQNLAYLSEVLTVEGDKFLEGKAFAQEWPHGSYTIVPHALGYEFTPVRMDVEIPATGAVPELKFVLEAASPENTSSIVAISAVDSGGRYSLAPGDDIELLNIGTQQKTSKPTTTNGVTVFSEQPFGGYFELTCTIDTNVWAPSERSTMSGSPQNNAPVVFEKRPRKTPLIARPYNLQVSNAPYAPLTGAERIIGPERIGTNGSVVRYLPFALTFGAVKSGRVQVFPSGDLVFGLTAFDRFSPPLESFSPADIVISTFSMPFFADSSALAETGVWWKVSGEAPNRVASVEWRKMETRICADNSCPGIGSFTFQVRMEEGTGRITMNYGTITPDTVSRKVNIGLRGADRLDVRVVKDVLNVNWNAPQLSTQLAGNNLQVSKANAPANGLSYIWSTPPVTSVDDDLSGDDIDLNAPNLFWITSSASEVIMIRGLEGATISLVDIMGRTLRRSKAIPALLEWDVTTCVVGRYTLVVEEPNGSTFTQPVIIIR